MTPTQQHSDTPSRQDIRAAFERSAADYDAVAILQREVATRLLERLDLLKMVPDNILDLGSGTGHCSEALSQRYPKARLTAIDLAHSMLQYTRKRFGLWQRLRRSPGFVCGDAGYLPFADNCFDMVFSNLTLQWCGDLEQTFNELQRVLKPGGVLFFTTLGPDTLKELRNSWAAVDGHVHVNPFIDMHDIGDAMMHARLAEPVMDMEMITMTYRDAMTLMRDLKTLGAHNINPARNHGLTGPRRLQQVCKAYEQYRSDDVLPASYEVVYGHAWGSENKTSTQGTAEFNIPIDKIGHQGA